MMHQGAMKQGQSEVDALRARVQAMLTEHFGRFRTVAHFEYRHFRYSTSFPLRELHVVFDDGTTLHLVLKDLSRGALSLDVQRAKPLFLYQPAREIETYRALLAPAGLSTATYYGSWIEPDYDRYELLLEFVPGWTLFECEAGVWPEAARWLAGMHTRFAEAADLTERAERAQLLHFDASFYNEWKLRAEMFVDTSDLSSETCAQLQRIMRGYDRVVERLASLPRTFIHGEFFASNVLVENGTRVCPIDWEMAGIGPGLIDLAALVAGGWTREQRTMLARSYWEALPPRVRTDFDAFLIDLDYCSLHIAMQWLGWAPDWSPPPEHRQNWLSEALRLGALLKV